mmetsp:Transcript_33768/g.52119  ORF Transcript_33768/g.52119 Transcript_33768/m.52119 type:complete len:170 (+) Transcript_33768:344-853(+)
MVEHETAIRESIPQDTRLELIKYLEEREARAKLKREEKKAELEAQGIKAPSGDSEVIFDSENEELGMQFKDPIIEQSLKSEKLAMSTPLIEIDGTSSPVKGLPMQQSVATLLSDREKVYEVREERMQEVKQMAEVLGKQSEDLRVPKTEQGDDDSFNIDGLKQVFIPKF